MTLYVWAEPKTEYVVAKGILPAAASPAATEIMFGSAMPSWKKRSGKAFPKSMDFSDSVVSAPTTTTLGFRRPRSTRARSEEHTSELQSHSDLVCRLLLEKKKRT